MKNIWLLFCLALFFALGLIGTTGFIIASFIHSDVIIDWKLAGGLCAFSVIFGMISVIVLANRRLNL